MVAYKLKPFRTALEVSGEPPPCRKLGTTAPTWSDAGPGSCVSILTAPANDETEHRTHPEIWVDAHWWENDRASLFVAETLGVNVRAALEASRPADTVDDKGKLVVGRATIVRAFGREVLTRTGQPRSARIKDCGHLRPAMRGRELGLCHWRCKDRLCPSCAGRRAREMASALLYFAKLKADSGSRILFVTLTQKKHDITDEDCAGAMTRWLATWRNMTSKRGHTGRAFCEMFAGAIRGVEVTWSPKGKKHYDGHVVKYSGWHAHGHILVEVRPGFTLRQATAEIKKLWRWATPKGEISGAAQSVQQVAPVAEGGEEKARSHIYEVCKYPLKLPGTSSPEVLRAAGIALASRKTLDGVGEWRGALGEGRKLRDLAEGKEPTAPVRMADQRVRALKTPEGILSFFEHKGRNAGAFYMPTSKMRAAVLNDPRTFDERDAAKDDDKRCRGSVAAASRSPVFNAAWPPPKPPDPPKPPPEQMRLYDEDS